MDGEEEGEGEWMRGVSGWRGGGRRGGEWMEGRRGVDGGEGREMG